MSERTSQLRRAINGSLSEDDFLEMVIDLCHQYKWRVAHFRPGMMRSGKWVTPVQADGAGFPDLTLTRRNKDGTAMLMFLEIKRQKGKLTEAQSEWLKILADVPGVIAKVCYPSDWEIIAEMLK